MPVMASPHDATQRPVPVETRCAASSTRKGTGESCSPCCTRGRGTELVTTPERLAEAGAR